MYQQSAGLYDLFFRDRDYKLASQKLTQFVRRCAPSAVTLLEVACGTGRYLEHLQHEFRVEGLDLSADMLDIARTRCPGVPLQRADFTAFDLERTFDAIACLFASIGYARSIDQLDRAVHCMAQHLRPGGVLAIEPALTPERFVPDKLVLDTANDPDVKATRMYVARRVDRVSVYDIHYLVGSAGGVNHFTEHHELGLFTSTELRRAFDRAGVDVVLEDPDGLFGYGLIVGVRRDT
jgi:SAM-dependent methyltransferase